MEEIVGIGTDIVSVERFARVHYPQRVAAFYLTTEEWETLKTSPNLPQSLASRFAAKEAVIKSLPVPLSPLDFEITAEGTKPAVRWKEPIPYRMYLSIAHEQEFACAMALAIHQ